MHPNPAVQFKAQGTLGASSRKLLRKLHLYWFVFVSEMKFGAPLSVIAIPVPVFISATPNGGVEQELFALRTIRNWIDMRIKQLPGGRRI